MKNFRNTTALIVACMATPVFAGGLAEPVVQPAPAPVVVAPQQTAGWGGFYVGGQIGTISAESEIEDFEVTIDAELDGTFYGLHIGYMYDIGSFVLGAELDYDMVNFDEATFSGGGESFTESVDEDGNIVRLKARVGYNAGSFLPYGTAGIARLEADSEETNGMFFGAGVAYKATESFLVGGEVLQHQFDEAFDTDQDLDATTLSLRASYRF